MTRCVVISRGFCHGIAMEIALKLKELTYVTAEPYSSADFQHGPMAMIEKGFPVILLAPRGVMHAHMLEFTRELKERNADLIAISDSPDILELGNSALPFADGAPELAFPGYRGSPGAAFRAPALHGKGNRPGFAAGPPESDRHPLGRGSAGRQPPSYGFTFFCT